MSDRFTLRHFKCVSKITEAEAQVSFEASKSPWFDEMSVSRHEDCYSSALALDLRFLRACHQIYDEARSFCYTDNTFSFDGWRIFAKFVRTVTRVSYVRSIRFSTCCVFTSDRAFIDESLQNISNKLTALQRIHIDLEQLRDSRWKDDQAAGEVIHLTQQLLCFARTGLKTAAVVISDARFCDRFCREITQPPRDDDKSQVFNRLTMTQKQEYSLFLRNALLQHGGKGTESSRHLI